jgi:hypothetical protein
MWYSQKEIIDIWRQFDTLPTLSPAKNNSNSNLITSMISSGRLFSPLNTSIILPSIDLSSPIKPEDYLDIWSAYCFGLNKKYNHKEDVVIKIGLNPYTKKQEEVLKKSATHLDQNLAKYIYDPSKVEPNGLALNMDRFGQLKNQSALLEPVLGSATLAFENTVIDSAWKNLELLRNKNLIRPELKQNYYNPRKKSFYEESEIKLELVDAYYHYLKYDIVSDDSQKIINGVIDQVNQTLGKHYEYQVDLISRINHLSVFEDKKSSLRDILGLSKSEYTEYNQKFDDKIQKQQEDLAYYKSYLLVIEQNINTLTKIKTLMLKSQTIKLVVPYYELWHSLFTMAVSIDKDEEFCLYYLAKTEELVLVSESDAVTCLLGLVEEVVLDTPEIKQKISEFKESSDFFNYLGVGIQKVSSFIGSELDGVKFTNLIDLQADSFDYAKKTNLDKIIALDYKNTSLNTKLNPINQYNTNAFEIFKQLDLPFVSYLNEDGKLKGLPQKFVGMESLSLYYVENYLVDIYKKHNEYLCKIKSGLVTKYLSVEDGITELYVMPESNYIVSFGDFDCKDYLLSKKDWGLPAPLFVNGKQQLWVNSIEDLVAKTVNPVYRLVLEKNLKYDFFEHQTSVIVSDTSSKIPLGLSAIQHRSKILTDFRSDKNIDDTKQNTYFDSLYNECLNLFQKYEVVQIQLTQSENIMFQNWFFGKNLDQATKTQGILYFYKKLIFTDLYNKEEGYTFDTNLNYLNPTSGVCKDIYLQDEFSNIYQFADYIISYGLTKKLLDLYLLTTSLKDTNQIFASDGLTKTLDHYQTIYDKAKIINIFKSCSQNIDQSKLEPDNFYELASLGLDVMAMCTLCDTSVVKVDKTLETVILGLARFYEKKQPSSKEQPSDLAKEPIIAFLQQETINFCVKFKKYIDIWDLKEAYQLILLYLQDFEELVLPIITNTNTNYKGELQLEIANVICMFCDCTKIIIPVLAEQLNLLINNPITVFDSAYSYSIIKNINQTNYHKVATIKALKAKLKTIKEGLGIAQEQCLYADFTMPKDLWQYHRYLQILLNLAPKNLTNIQGGVQKLDFDSVEIIIDTILDNSLISTAIIRNLSKILLNFKQTQGFRIKDNLVVKIYLEQVDPSQKIGPLQKIIEKITSTSSWPDINVQTEWKTIDQSQFEELVKLQNFDKINQKEQHLLNNIKVFLSSK